VCEAKRRYAFDVALGLIGRRKPIPMNRNVAYASASLWRQVDRELSAQNRLVMTRG
jgi:hypothetical protein